MAALRASGSSHEGILTSSLSSDDCNENGEVFGGGANFGAGACGFAISTTLEDSSAMGGLFAGGGTGAVFTGVQGTSAANNIDASCSCKRSDSRRSASDELGAATGVWDAFGDPGGVGLLSAGRAVEVRPLPNPSVSPGAFGNAVLGTALTGATMRCETGIGRVVTGFGSGARGKFKVGFTSAFNALVVNVAAGAEGGAEATGTGGAAFGFTPRWKRCPREVFRS